MQTLKKMWWKTTDQKYSNSLFWVTFWTHVSLCTGTRISSFTQADLASRSIQYVHTSDEEKHADQFSFTVSDGTNEVNDGSDTDFMPSCWSRRACRNECLFSGESRCDIKDLVTLCQIRAHGQHLTLFFVLLLIPYLFRYTQILALAQHLCLSCVCSLLATVAVHSVWSITSVLCFFVA